MHLSKPPLLSLRYPLNRSKQTTMYRFIFRCLLLLSLPALANAQEEWVCKSGQALNAMEQLLDFRSSPFTDGYDVKYHRLAWEINPNNYYIEGTVTTYFKPVGSPLTQLYFDFSEALQIDGILYHGQPLAAFSQSNDLLGIPLPEAVPAGTLDSISITYQGAPPANGFGSFAQSTHAGQPVLWTLSEPYGAKDWWPCKQDLNDKIDSVDILVRTPQAYKTASNGVLQEVIADGESHTYHWKHRYPIPAYLIAIAVTNYATYSDYVPVEGGAPIEVLNYVFPENLASAQQATTATVDIMLLFNELFGLYPFAGEKYGHAQFGWGGGMEHQTMSFMGGFSHLLQAHELAHQWFGDKVTCGSWQDIWLNEGFATYLEGLTYEHGLGPNTWEAWLAGKIDHVTSAPDGAVFVTDTSSVSRIFSSRLSYSKGAMLLHMLRWKLGDEAFFAGVRNYLQDPSLAFGYARTADLQYHLEQAGGQDLDEFFSDWLYGEGYPTYHLRWFQDGATVFVRLQQATSHSSVDFFEMPVPVRFTGGGLDTTLVFEHTEHGQVFTAELPGAAQQAELDPEQKIVSKGNTVAEAVFTRQRAMEAEALEVSISPNPVADVLSVALPEGAALYRASLYGADGRWLASWERPGKALQMGRWPSGTYTLELETSMGLSRKMLLKQ
ncbi:M1 family metallopeptidase [Phaeodactylibacter luteus]|uniref:Aminopeptidase N n=2 Tax=Phaeodactylibacter luteus TaxID=1564516 RepID=A0A5C6RVE6_9BACT|nr:M1 family metallopeptidase [Phaeodactylibacter luteus]